MKKLKDIWSRLRSFTPLKYVVVIVLAVFVIGFLEDNSVRRLIQNRQTKAELEQEIQQYDQQHEANQARIRELNHNPKAIEKIARERYFMKTDDEDIFVLSDDIKPETDDDEAAE